MKRDPRVKTYFVLEEFSHRGSVILTFFEEFTWISFVLSQHENQAVTWAVLYGGAKKCNRSLILSPLNCRQSLPVFPFKT